MTDPRALMVELRAPRWRPGYTEPLPPHPLSVRAAVALEEQAAQIVDMHEQIAALQSREVCVAAHDNVAEIERLTQINSTICREKGTLLIQNSRFEDERDLLRAENLDLHEQLSAIKSPEVCAAAHDNVDECGYCQRDRLQQIIERLRAALLAAKREHDDECDANVLPWLPSCTCGADAHNLAISLALGEVKCEQDR